MPLADPLASYKEKEQPHLAAPIRSDKQLVEQPVNAMRAPNKCKKRAPKMQARKAVRYRVVPRLMEKASARTPRESHGPR